MTQECVTENGKSEFAQTSVVTKISDWVDKVHFPSYDFFIVLDRRGSIYLQAKYLEEDIDDPLAGPVPQLTRRWFISPAMTKSEVIQTAFKCVLTSMEHRTREWFTYKGERIFGPHYDVDSLYYLCVAGNLAHRQ